MMANKTITIFFFTIITFLSCSIFTINDEKKNYVISLSDYDKISNQDKPSLQMFKAIEKYSEEYCIPKHIIYNIAFKETRYHGPFDWDYKHNLGSYAGALGPMQIMPSTAKQIHNKRISKNVLKNDIEFNVMTSAILLNKLFSIYKDWGKVCGVYNTGRPIINGYSKFCTSNLQYWENWYLFSGIY